MHHSAEGSACATEPPNVPRERIGMWPTSGAAALSTPKPSSSSSSACSISRWTVSPPMRRPSPSRAM